MLVDFRPDARLDPAATRPVDFSGAVGPVVAALGAAGTDLSRVRVVCDWVQYRANFRDVVDVRPILADPCGSVAAVEVAVDVRRAGAECPASATRRALDGTARVPLEDFGPTSASCVWAFNALYWSALDAWEQATGASYDQALPGGASDATNRDAARALVTDLFAVWDRLAAARALPPELYVVELGVGNGTQARVFLDELREADAAGARGYYRRLHYLMGDYSPAVLAQARTAVREHAGHVSTLVLDATAPGEALGFLAGKVFLVWLSNVYDNLPTDEVAQLAGRPYVVEARAYLTAAVVDELAALTGAGSGAVPGLVRTLLHLGPDLLAEAAPDRIPDTAHAVAFWQHVWAGLRLEERYVPLPGLDAYAIAPGVGGEALRPLLDSGADVRMHVSNGAVAGFTDTLRLLHPHGVLLGHDLFVTDAHTYRTRFAGPGKYDGSVVNWVNGALLAHVGRRRGFQVDFTPFAHRAGSHIVTMTARPGE